MKPAAFDQADFDIQQLVKRLQDDLRSYAGKEDAKQFFIDRQNAVINGILAFREAALAAIQEAVIVAKASTSLSWSNIDAAITAENSA